MTLAITYQLTFEDDQTLEFGMEFDDKTMMLEAKDESEHSKTPPDWARLENHQCPHCPLIPDTNEHCPPARHLAEIVNQLGMMVSHREVNLRVVSAEREVTGKTGVHTVFSSIMGLMMASTGCPYTAYLRPMARFHLPLASFEETIFRSVSAYLVAQYMRHEQGLSFDTSLEGLVKIYEDIQTVNLYFTNRLKSSGEFNETNAIAMLDIYAQSLPMAIGASLEDFKDLFHAHLEPSV
jgi:hypothetical protein